MKKYIVESRRDYTDLYDNYLGDYIEAESEEEAIKCYIACLIAMGCGLEEVEDMEYQVKEYWH